MIGVLTLGILVVWFIAVLMATLFISSKLPRRIWRIPVAAMLFAGFLVLPVADEVIGAFQFAQVCAQATEITVDRQKAKGRAVRLQQVPHPLLPGYLTIPRKAVPYKAVPIQEESWNYTDINSGETLVRYKVYKASGGLLARMIVEGDTPLTFSSSCGPEERSRLFAELGIRTVN